MWLIQYSKMNEETYISFDEFYIKSDSITEKTDEEILEEVEEIRKAFAKEGE